MKHISLFNHLFKSSQTYLLFALIGMGSAVFAQSAPDKQAMTERMQEIAEILSQSEAKQGNEADSLRQELEQISAALGGDRPALGDRTSWSRTASNARVAPAPPPDLTSTLSSFSFTGPVPIPDEDPVGISETLTVTTADTFLFDVDITLDIPHTWSSDLDITLTSPAGTVVTLTTDNGSGSEDTFAGALFDDSAPDAVVDVPFLTLGVQTPLIPEGAMAQFYGEDPNGDWTLEVSDDAAGDTGNLESFTLDITTLNQAPVDIISAFQDAPGTPILDFVQVAETIAVAGLDEYLCDVNVTTDITHTFSSDIAFTVTSPAGTVQVLSFRYGGNTTDIFSGTLFDDAADAPISDFVHTNNVTSTPLTPEGALGAFIGEDPNGDWELEILDLATGDTGTLNSWGLEINTCRGVFIAESVPVPTLSNLGVLLMMLLMAGLGVVLLRARNA